MVSYYVDLQYGSDLNDGLSWDTAWATTTNNPISSTVIDAIYVAKTPDPVCMNLSGLFAPYSKVVQLDYSITENIDSCETSWTSGNSWVGCFRNSTLRKEGFYCAMFSLAAGFTTGLVAYKQLPSTLDLSNYQQLSCQFRTQLQTSGLYFGLCSDISGRDIVNRLNMPKIYVSGEWYPMTIDYSGALNNSINSISLYSDIDIGARVFFLDNIIACKASSEPDSLSLTNLFSLDSNAIGGTWFSPQSISGNIVLIDNGPSTIANAGAGQIQFNDTRGMLYRRECIRATPEMLINSNSTSWYTNISGGMNKTTNQQDGMTFILGPRNNNLNKHYIFNANTMSIYSNFGAIKIALCGPIYSNPLYGFSLFNCIIAHSNSIDGGIGGSWRNNATFSGCQFYNNIYGASAYIAHTNIVDCYFANQLSSADYTYSSSTIYMANCIFKNNKQNSSLSYDVSTRRDSGSNSIINNCDFENIVSLVGARSTYTNCIFNKSVRPYNINSTSIINSVFCTGAYIDLAYLTGSPSSIFNLYNCSFSGSVEYTVATPSTASNYSKFSKIYSQNHDKINNNNLIINTHALLSYQSGVMYKNNGYALSYALDSTSSYYDAGSDINYYHPIYETIATIPVKNNQQITISCWCKSTFAHSNNYTQACGIRCLDADKGYITENQQSIYPTGTTQWQQLSLTLTPIQDTVLSIEIFGYVAVTTTYYFDDFKIEGASTESLSSMNYSLNGLPYLSRDGGGAVATTWIT